jgi:hypothetical protein
MLQSPPAAACIWATSVLQLDYPTEKIKPFHGVFTTCNLLKRSGRAKIPNVLFLSTADVHISGLEAALEPMCTSVAVLEPL